MERLASPGGTIELEVLPELGCRIHRLRAFGRDLLRTPDDVDAHRTEPFFWGAYAMAPWCNRVTAGLTAVAGHRVDLAPNFEDGTALHGQVYLRPWTAVGPAAWAIDAGGDGWPWAYRATLGLELRDDGVRVDLGLANRSGERMPAGLGLHPWFLTPAAVAIRGASVHPDNHDTAPEPVPATGVFRLRDLVPMPPDLDATWTDLGSPPISLRWDDPAIRLDIAVAGPSVCVAGASPSGFGAVALEPETHAPQGLRRLLRGEPDGLAWLAPGRTLHLAVDLAIADDGGPA